MLNCLQVKPSERKHVPEGVEPESVFNYLNFDEDDDYLAYEKDMAIAHFYFESSTALQYMRQPRLTWTAFIGQIGGLLGLCLGFSIVSIVELAYWFLYRLVVGITTPSKRGKEFGEGYNRYKKYHNKNQKQGLAFAPKY